MIHGLEFVQLLGHPQRRGLVYHTQHSMESLLVVSLVRFNPFIWLFLLLGLVKKVRYLRIRGLFQLLVFLGSLHFLFKGEGIRLGISNQVNLHGLFITKSKTFQVALVIPFFLVHFEFKQDSNLQSLE